MITQKTVIPETIFMLLSKTRLFIFLAFIIASPFVIHKLTWIAGSEKTVGMMGFKGKSYAGTYVHRYSNIQYIAGKDTIWFTGPDNIFFEEGKPVPVRFQRSNHYDARIDLFVPLWGDTIVYGGIPFVILLALFLHPQVIPRRSRIKISTKTPVWQLLPPNS